ncbi:hypothetical protein [Abyssisolibacter fermentans]|nr:hypothetical protein [Abyssisolibacter fermentans]
MRKLTKKVVTTNVIGRGTNGCLCVCCSYEDFNHTYYIPNYA